MRKSIGTWMALASSLVITLLVTACGGGASKAPSQAGGGSEGLTIRVAGTTSEDSSQIRGLNKFKELVEAKTNGQVKVEVFPNLQLGSLREQAEATQLGTIQMSLSLLSTLSTFDEELKVFEYPYLWPTTEETLWKVVDDQAGKQALQNLENHGFKGLGFWAGGFKAITTNSHPVLAPNDLKGMKFRVVPSQTLIEQYKAWGANPVPIDFAELYSALQQGIVDGQENPLETIWTQKYHEVQKQLTLTNHGYQFHVFVANKAWFEGLSPDIQQVLVEAEEEARLYARELNRTDNGEYLKKLKAAGLQIHELTEDQMKPFKELSYPLHEKLSDTERKKQLLNIITEAVGSAK